MILREAYDFCKNVYCSLFTMTKNLDTMKDLIIGWTDEQTVAPAHYVQSTKLRYTEEDSLLDRTLAILLWALFSTRPQHWLIYTRTWPNTIIVSNSSRPHRWDDASPSWRKLKASTVCSANTEKSGPCLPVSKCRWFHMDKHLSHFL